MLRVMVCLSYGSAYGASLPEFATLSLGSTAPVFLTQKPIQCSRQALPVFQFCSLGSMYTATGAEGVGIFTK